MDAKESRPPRYATYQGGRLVNLNAEALNAEFTTFHHRAVRLFIDFISNEVENASE